MRVLDPACGDGRFLAAVRDELVRRHGVGRGALELVGVDIDATALASARRHLGDSVHLIHADALSLENRCGPFDLVIGNPPFLSPLRSEHRPRPDSSGHYADAAVEFWDRAHDLVRPDGGVVAMVLPQSVLANRDAAGSRERIAYRAGLEWCWWSPVSVFPDAQVITCALVTVTGTTTTSVQRVTGPEFEPVAAREVAALDGGSWSGLVSDTLGIPDLDPTSLSRAGTLVDRAMVRGDFRDQYYGLVGAVTEEGSGPALVTSGLIDPGRCRWGERPVRFAGQLYAAPRIARSALDDRMRAWVRRRLVPKVLVASQTRVIEAVADPTARWVPSVPVVSVMPQEDGVEAMMATPRIGAVLTSPVASAWVAQRSAGSGRSATALRISASTLASLPWPAGDLEPAVAAFEAGDITRCGQLVDAAYGLVGSVADDLLAWWCSALPRGCG